MYDPISLASALTPDFVSLATPGVYYFAAHCAITFRVDPVTGHSIYWVTPPATFCLYAAGDDPAGCTAMEHFGAPLGAGTFIGAEFIDQIGAQFAPPAAPNPSPPPPPTTPTTRRRTTPTTSVTEPATTPTTTCNPMVPPYCPK